MADNPLGFLGNFLSGANPAGALATQMGQGPGQAGAPGGPAAGMPAQGGAAGGGSQPPTVGQPMPQNLQSTPDLAQMYLQLASRQQGWDNLMHGMANMANAIYPGRPYHPTFSEQDPGAIMGNLMQLQQYQRQQWLQNQFAQSVDPVLQSMGLDPQAWHGYALAAGPDFMNKVIETRMGFNDPATRAMMAGRNNFFNQHGGEDPQTPGVAKDGTPLPPEMADPISYGETQKGRAAGGVATAQAQVEDRNAAQRTLPGLKQSTGDMLRNLDKIISADPSALGEYLGGNAWKPLGGEGLSGVAAALLPGDTELAGSIKQAVAETFGEGFREVAGKSSRVTNTESMAMKDALTKLQNRGQTPQEFQDAALDVKNRLLHTLGTGYGEAGLADAAPAWLQGTDGNGNSYIDPQYTPGGSRYWKAPTVPKELTANYPGLTSQTPKGPQAQQPPTAAPAPAAAPSSGAAQAAPLSKTLAGPQDLRGSKNIDADFNALPSGALFIGPDGKQRRKP
jgi:hypothetical protein